MNGVKKWITNGMFCDYFVTAVRTGKKGMKGVSMLLVERSPGVSTKQISTSYSKSGGTALILYDNVKVPVENMLGKENQVGESEEQGSRREYAAGASPRVKIPAGENPRG